MTGRFQVSWPYPVSSAFWMLGLTHGQKGNMVSQMGRHSCKDSGLAVDWPLRSSGQELTLIPVRTSSISIFPRTWWRFLNFFWRELNRNQVKIFWVDHSWLRADSPQRKLQKGSLGLLDPSELFLLGRDSPWTRAPSSIYLGRAGRQRMPVKPENVRDPSEYPWPRYAWPRPGAHLGSCLPCMELRQGRPQPLVFAIQPHPPEHSSLSAALSDLLPFLYWQLSSIP